MGAHPSGLPDNGVSWQGFIPTDPPTYPSVSPPIYTASGRCQLPHSKLARVWDKAETGPVLQGRPCSADTNREQVRDNLRLRASTVVT